MVVDPLSIAGLGLGAASLAIQLADGLRKGFVFIENAAHAEADSKAFGVRLAIEHQRFISWSDLSGLSQAAEAEQKDDGETDESHNLRIQKAKRAFDSFVKYSGPVIVPILLEMNMVMSQLSNSADRYSDFIESRADDDHENATPTDDVADIAGLPPKAPSLMDKAQSLTLSIQARNPPFTQRDNDAVQSSSRQPKSSSTGIFKRMLKTGKKAANVKSVRWVIHDAKACGTKITRVHELNAFLHESLGHVARDRQIERDERFQQLLVRVEKDTKAVLRAVTDTHAASTSDNASVLTGSTAVEQPFRSDFARQAAQFILDAFDQNARSDVTVRVDEEEVSKLEYLDWLEDGFRQAVKLADGRHGWVEWRKYTEINLAPKTEPPRFGIDPASEKGMDRLVSLLKIEKKPKEFSVPPCLGYFIDEEKCRIGMLYEPPAAESVPTPRSLFSFLGKVEMSLSNRMQIARTLAQWLLHLHSVRWLHKGIESASVLFFSSEAGPASSLENPYMTGFSYARTASTDPSRPTTKPHYEPPHVYYVHPDYQDAARAGGFRKVYDIYSLGIILIELAYWQPIEQILRSSVNSSSSSIGADAHAGADRADPSASTTTTTQNTAPTNRHPRPLDPEVEGRRLVSGQHPVLDHLRTLVGDKYYAVARSCLQGMSAFGLPNDAPESDTEISTDLLDAFGRDVVEPLRAIVL